MIPSRLNLLSPQKRQYLQAMVRFQFVKSNLEVLLIILCLIGIVLLGSQYVLQDYFTEINSTIITLQSEHTKTNKEVIEINKTLIKLEKIQEQFSPITPLIPEITNAVPEGVVLSILNINKENKSILLSGNAETRDDLLLLGNQLETIEWIQNADIPISQLTKKENVQFAINAKMK